MKPAKKIAVDTFERIKEETKKTAEDVAEQTGLKPQETGTEQPQAGQPAQRTPADDAKKKALTTQRLKKLEEEIEMIRKKREREEEAKKEVPEENIEAGRKITQLGEEKEKPLPPPVIAAKRKTGTGERRIKGSSG